MFQKITTYTFVLLYFIAMLRPISPFVEYAINYDYIAEVLCVNQDKPELSCNGKCYVIKQLEKQKKEDYKSLQISMEEYPIGFVEILSIEKSVQTFTVIPKIYFKESNYTFSLLKPCEHPPELA